MSLWDLSAAELLERTASADPTPGGGSVAAITGALGLGLVCMALEVSARRRDAAPELTDLLDRARALLDGLKLHPDADVLAFQGYMAALALPKVNAGQQEARRMSIQEAALAATEAPLAAARELLLALVIAREAARLAHRQIVSDVGAGAALLGAAVQATLLSVDINLGSLPLQPREAARSARVQLGTEAAALQQTVLEQVAARLKR